MENSFHIDPDLAKASTLSAEHYFGDKFFQHERKQIFHRTWQLVGRADQVAKPGDFVTADVSGQPIVVTRGADGTLRAFHNVCRHRASLVATEACGNSKVLQCPYHGWTYGLDGKLQGCREFEGVEQFDKKDFGLKEVRLDTWGPFVFVHLGSGEPTLKEVLGVIPDEVKQFGADLDGYRFLVRRDYVVNCNWKVYIDNYLEGYHLPMVHPALYRELDYTRYRVDTFRYYSSQLVRSAKRRDKSANTI